MSTSSLFLGNSAYSSDFAEVIDRTVSIAKLPMLQLEQQRLQTVDRGSAITDLQGKFESLRIALSDLSSSVASANLAATFSATGIATATLGENATAGSFTLEVSDLGSYSSYVAAAGVTDPGTDGLGSELTKTLVVDGVETTLTLSANTLDALAKAITDSGAGLSASVVNVSSSSTPSYKLVLQGGKLGAQTIALKDGDVSGADLLEGTALNEGSNVLYKVNGILVNAESRTVTLAPDVSVTLSATTAISGPVTLSVKRSSSQIVDRLRAMVTAYNAATAKLDEHRGQNQGVLRGQSVVSTLSKVLRSLPSYSTNSGDFQNFTDIGLSFDDKGVLSLNASTLSGLSDEKLDQLVSFLGGGEDGGFAAFALNTLDAATAVESGILALEKKSYTDREKAEASQVQQMQERLTLMETNLRERFAALDSAIAALQQQALFFNNLFESMRIAQQTYSK